MILFPFYYTKNINFRKHSFCVLILNSTRNYPRVVTLEVSSSTPRPKWKQFITSIPWSENEFLQRHLSKGANSRLHFPSVNLMSKIHFQEYSIIQYIITFILLISCIHWHFYLFYGYTKFINWGNTSVFSSLEHYSMF